MHGVFHQSEGEEFQDLISEDNDKELENEAKSDIKRLQQMDSVALDHGYIRQRHPFLASVCQYNGYKICWHILDSSTRTVVEKLKECFSKTGNPMVLQSDGGP